MKLTPHACHMIKTLVAHLDWQLHRVDSGYLRCMSEAIEPGSMSDLDLRSAEKHLRELADDIARTRSRLMVARAA